MDFELKGRTAFVTGGSRGIGRAIALKLASQGANIAICGRTRENLDQTAADIRDLGVEAWTFQTDVSKLDELQAFAEGALAAAGGVDILVNNAVTSTAAPFDEQTDELFRYHIDVKLMAYIRLARIILPHLEQQGWGRIVNIGGMTARITAPLRVTNGVVNAGVANFTKQLAMRAAQGGTAVGTGLNTHPEFGGRVAAGLKERFSLGFREADNHCEAQHSRDAAVELSGQLKTIAAPTAACGISTHENWRHESHDPR